MGTNDSNLPFIERYTEYILGNIPDQYADLANPLSPSAENISTGKQLYKTQSDYP